MAQRNRTAKTEKRKRVIMKYDAPEAEAVVITGSFCDWDEKHGLKKDKMGVWKKTLTLSPGHYEYRFIIDGQWRDDPACNERVPNTFGTENCVLDV